MMNCTEIKVRGYHLDFYGHVNNARYLEFMEEARWVMSEEHMDLKRLQEKGVVFAVVNININYRKQAGLGDILEFFIGLARIGNKSATFRQEIRFKDTETIVADADVTFVLADLNTGKATDIDNELRAMLKQL